MVLEGTTHYHQVWNTTCSQQINMFLAKH